MSGQDKLSDVCALSSTDPGPDPHMPDHGAVTAADRIRATLHSGAVGDALGYRCRWEQGTKSSSSPLAISDDTQMSLYVMDGLLEVMEWAAEGSAADPPATVWLAMLRWYRSQRGDFPEDTPRPLLRWIDADDQPLGHERHPDPVCLSGLEHTQMRLINRVANPDAVTATAVSRVTGYAMLPDIDHRLRVSLVRQSVVLTHGSTTAWVSAAVFALILTELLAGSDLDRAVHQALKYLRQENSVEEQLSAVLAQIGRYTKQPTLNPGRDADHPQRVPADRVLACALGMVATNPSGSLGVLADQLFDCLGQAPHEDLSTLGSIAGQLLGARDGHLPHHRRSDLESALAADQVAVLDEMATRWLKFTEPLLGATG